MVGEEPVLQVKEDKLYGVPEGAIIIEVLPMCKKGLIFRVWNSTISGASSNWPREYDAVVQAATTFKKSPQWKVKADNVLLRNPCGKLKITYFHKGHPLWDGAGMAGRSGRENKLRFFYGKAGPLLDGRNPDFFETLPSIEINVPKTISPMPIRTALDKMKQVIKSKKKQTDTDLREISKDVKFLTSQLMFSGASGNKEDELFTYLKRALVLQDKTREEVAQEREIFDDFLNTQPGLTPTNT